MAENFWLDVDRKEIREYIRRMLGAPKLIVELGEDQLNFCIDKAETYINDHAHPNYTGTKKEALLREGALIYAKHMLGRVRQAYGQFYLGLLSGDKLVQEAQVELTKWQHWVTRDPG